MRVDESRKAAEGVIGELQITSEDENADYYHALLNNEQFTAACYLYHQTKLYTKHEDAVEANRDARDALKRAVREHAQRVAVGVED